MESNKKNIIKSAITKVRSGLSAPTNRTDLKAHDELTKLNDKTINEGFNKQAENNSKASAGYMWKKRFENAPKGSSNADATNYANSRKSGDQAQAVRMAKDDIRKKATSNGKNISMPKKGMFDSLKNRINESL